MTEGFHIREARAADAAAIARVQVESWHTTFRGLLPEDFLAEITLERRVQRWAESLNDPERAEEECVFVAERDAGEVFGFASGGRERGGDAEFDGELYAIYLLESFQRRRVGRRLMLAVVERLVASGYRAMLVWALEVNDTGRRFYEKLGGRLARTGTHARGAHTLATVGYGWPDIRQLRERLREG
jgi:GNAT superfamily N-acetyltransferase